MYDKRYTSIWICINQVPYSPWYITYKLRISFDHSSIINVHHCTNIVRSICETVTSSRLLTIWDYHNIDTFTIWDSFVAKWNLCNSIREIDTAICCTRLNEKLIQTLCPWPIGKNYRHPGPHLAHRKKLSTTPANRKKLSILYVQLVVTIVLYCLYATYFVIQIVIQSKYF